MDLAATYQVPVFHTVSPWVKVEILNLTNNQKLISWDTTVTPDPNSPLDANGLPTGYIQGPRFGQATCEHELPGAGGRARPAAAPTCCREGFGSERARASAFGARASV